MSDFPYKFGAIIDDKGIGFFDWIFWEKDFKSKSKSKTCWIFGFFKSTDQILPTFGPDLISGIPWRLWLASPLSSVDPPHPTRRNFFMSLQTVRAKVTLDVAEVVCIFVQSRFWRRFAARFLRSGLLPASDWENRSRKTFCNFSERPRLSADFTPAGQSALCIPPLLPNPTRRFCSARRINRDSECSFGPIAKSAAAAAENKVG